MAYRQVLLGVSGGIAAYKAAELTRRLRAAGAEVRVVMTRAAQAFVAPLTFQALSGNPVRLDLLDPAAEAGMDHIELARWADLVLVAPASADLMARLAAGMADDLLATLSLATAAPLVLAPAMNQQMWRHPATQANARRLEERGVRLLGPASGEQACGEVGLGRMLEPAAIVQALMVSLPPGLEPVREPSAGQHASPSPGLTFEMSAQEAFDPATGDLTGTGFDHTAARETVPAADGLTTIPRTASPLAGRQVLVTAGPTREAIDPVRYVGNRSSGRMGYALAQALVGRGARVLLVSGPTALPAPAGVELIRVESALEMHEAVMGRIAGQDLFVATAAVADYRVADPAPAKIKKGQAELTLCLVRNPDILAAVAALRRGPFTVGFAAETERVEEQALGKLRTKGLDMIAANRVGGPQGGFEREDNALTVIRRDGRVDQLALMPKATLAEALTDLIEEAYAARSATQDS